MFYNPSIFRYIYVWKHIILTPIFMETGNCFHRLVFHTGIEKMKAHLKHSTSTQPRECVALGRTFERPTIPRTHFVCAYMCAWVCACMCASPFLCVCARCVCDRVHPSPHVLHLYSTCHGHVEMGAAVFSYCGQGTNVVCGAVKHRKIDLIKNVVPCYSPKFSLWSLPN
jgi:hypothetical protein